MLINLVIAHCSCTDNNMYSVGTYYPGLLLHIMYRVLSIVLSIISYPLQFTCFQNWYVRVVVPTLSGRPAYS